MNARADDGTAALSEVSKGGVGFPNPSVNQNWYLADPSITAKKFA
jgi:hypothetical protein